MDEENPSLVEFAVTMAMVVTAGLLGLFALGMLFRWTTARGAYAGIAACLLFTLWATSTTIKIPGADTVLLDLGRFNYRFSPFLIGVLGHVILVAVGMLASPLLGGPNPNATGLTLHDAARHRPGETE